MSAKKIKICLTDRPPVTVDPEAWEVIAEARDCDNQYEFQAFRRWWIKVRRHLDGRTIVYAAYSTVHPHESDRDGGMLLAAPYDGRRVADAIGIVAGSVGVDDLAGRCICDLPAQDIDAAAPPDGASDVIDR